MFYWFGFDYVVKWNCVIVFVISIVCCLLLFERLLFFVCVFVIFKVIVDMVIYVYVFCELL